MSTACRPHGCGTLPDESETETEETVTTVLQALCRLHTAFAHKPIEIKARLMNVAPPASWEEVSDVDLSCPQDGPVSFTACLDCPIDDVPNVWWLRASRHGAAASEVRRWVEVYPPGREEETAHEFAPVVCDGSEALATALPALAEELLEVWPPSVPAPPGA